METLQQRFEKYLTENHKETIENFIRTRIEEAKSKPCYTVGESPVSYDSSKYPVQNGRTIGECWKEDFQILCALTGDTQATYISGHGLYCVTVGDEIEDEVTRMIGDFAYKFVSENYDAVFEEVSFEADIEEGIKFEELAEKAISEYGIIVTMFNCLESFNNHDGLIDTLLNRQELYNDWSEDAFL